MIKKELRFLFYHAQSAPLYSEAIDQILNFGNMSQV